MLLIYILCNKQFGGFGHDFCYVCETDWTKQSKHHFYCNNNIKEIRKKEIKVQKLKEELEIELIEEEFIKMDYPFMNGKLNSYYNRYKNIEMLILQKLFKIRQKIIFSNVEDSRKNLIKNKMSLNKKDKEYEL